MDGYLTILHNLKSSAKPLSIACLARVGKDDESLEAVRNLGQFDRLQVKEISSNKGFQCFEQQYNSSSNGVVYYT
jgi:hypothetical protein